MFIVNDIGSCLQSAAKNDPTPKMWLLCNTCKIFAPNCVCLLSRVLSINVLFRLKCVWSSGTRTADIPSQQRLWSSTTDSLSVPAVRLSTVGRRAFTVAVACIWNDLPSDISSSASLLTFKRRLNAPISCYLSRSRLLTVQTVQTIITL